MKWNPFYADDPKLNKVRPEPGTSVLVTCLDKRGARKVVQAHCSDDAAQPFSTKSPVIAWAPMPEPYNGAAAPAQGHLFREAKAAILNAVRTAPAGYVENGKLRRHVMQTVGCSEGTYLARFPRTYPHRPDRKETGLTKTVYQRMDHILARKQEFSSFSS